MTESAAAQYTEAIAEARKLHPEAKEVVFPAGDFQAVKLLFHQIQPRYALVFILPDELDVNLAWKWLRDEWKGVKDIEVIRARAKGTRPPLRAYGFVFFSGYCGEFE